jgi:hypothetical protein
VNFRGAPAALDTSGISSFSASPNIVIATDMALG